MIPHKKLISRNLAQYSVLYTDTDTNSSIFLISQFPDIFTSGKNSFFIKGSLLLDPDTEVLVEIIDTNGNAVYLNPIKNYEEALSRIVSVEIYEDTPLGPGKLTILGRLRILPNGSPIPIEWKDSYNVKWSKDIYIDNRLPNTTPIKVYDTPEISVSEVLIPHRQVTLVSGSITGATGITLSGSISERPVNISSFEIPTYLIRSGQPIFKKNMEGGTISLLTDTNNQFTSSIKRVWNDTIIEVSSSYRENNLYKSFYSNDYSINYPGEPTYITSQLSRSYADIVVTKMKTFAGDIEKAKVFVKGVDFPGDYEIVSDNIIEPLSLLVTSSVSSHQPILDYGQLNTQEIINSYWTFGSMSSVDY